MRARVNTGQVPRPLAENTEYFGAVPAPGLGHRSGPLEKPPAGWTSDFGLLIRDERLSLPLMDEGVRVRVKQMSANVGLFLILHVLN